ncbi:endolytic transglycosylase MltG [Thermoflavimicrobium daqui]|uniref:Endolytic murein transglycosylase n=1 Tax=Thermoflavimicrobium daqui TaxID=2137476 RepID=A0A364K6D4_9BACL|nr:endolytic transglycosylase MltG [Thermoflavimicrobium daqui]RAL25772.1 endolytic transglycosylase MltG [Thermoflavimicrobium daqui]
MKKWRIYYAVFLALAWIITGYLYIYYTLDSPKRNEEIYITIPEKSSVKKVGEILEKSKVIHQDWFFAYYMKIKGIAIKAGDYRIQPNEKLSDILQKLMTGKQDGIKIIIPPGKNVKNIAEILEKNGLDGQGFLTALKNRQPKYEFEKQIPNDPKRYYKYEGYLFPETYFFKKGEQGEHIVDDMLAQFDKFIKKHEGQIEGKSMFQSKPFTIDQMVLIASLVEREGRKKEELKKIAGVFYNRLNKPNDPNFRRLRIDATNVFANEMENNKYTKVSDMNNKLITPYNTYKVDGLPPGAIGSPSQEAMEAAIHPEKHNFYFYTAKYDGSGLHYFAKTYDEHKKFIQLSQKNAKAGKGI